MKTAAQIQFDFAQAKKRADEIDEIAVSLSQVSKRDMESTLDEISGAWKGDNARQYLIKAEKLRTDIGKTSQELTQIAATIRTIARKMYEAEMEALRIATQRAGNASGGGFSSGGGGFSDGGGGSR